VSQTRNGGGVDEGAGAGGDATEVGQEVEGRALGGEHRRQRPGDGAQHGTRLHRVTVGDGPVAADGVVDLGERLVDARQPGHHTGGAGHEAGLGPGFRGQQAGAEVAEGVEVLGQGAGHQVSHHATGGVEGTADGHGQRRLSGTGWVGSGR
jgi:hypothetical protein